MANPSTMTARERAHAAFATVRSTCPADMWPGERHSLLCDAITAAIEAAEADATARERERCAKACRDQIDYWGASMITKEGAARCDTAAKIMDAIEEASHG